MRWYKFSIVLAVGLLSELIIAALSCALIKENGVWLSHLLLPTFAPRSFVVYGVLMETSYLFSALSLACYVKSKSDVPKGLMLLAAEGIADVLTLLFFFRFTYEITSFFFATATMLVSIIVTSLHLKQSDVAGIVRLPVLSVHVYFWSVLYCILMINFT